MTSKKGSSGKTLPSFLQKKEKPTKATKKGKKSK
jgi:hypothetical protein